MSLTSEEKAIYAQLVAKNQRSLPVMILRSIACGIATMGAVFCGAASHVPEIRRAMLDRDNL